MTQIKNTSPKVSPPYARRMQDVMSRIYSVLLRKNDADFMRKLALYGSLANGLWGEPQEVTELLESGFVADINRMSEAEREEGIS
jgi:hypothetical protein